MLRTKRPDRDSKFGKAHRDVNPSRPARAAAGRRRGRLRNEYRRPPQGFLWFNISFQMSLLTPSRHWRATATPVPAAWRKTFSAPALIDGGISVSIMAWI